MVASMTLLEQLNFLTGDPFDDIFLGVALGILIVGVVLAFLGLTLLLGELANGMG